MNKLLRTILPVMSIFCSLIMVGCGQSGHLYLPKPVNSATANNNKTNSNATTTSSSDTDTTYPSGSATPPSPKIMT